MINQGRIARLLSKKLTTSEFKELCSDLGIEYGDVPGKGVIGKSQSLIPYLQDKGRDEKELIQKLLAYKPDIFSGDDEDLIESFYLDQSLIPIESDQVGEAVVQLVSDDKEANQLLKTLRSLHTELSVIPDKKFRDSAYNTLEEAQNILVTGPKKNDEWPKHKTRAEFIIKKTHADILRQKQFMDEARLQAKNLLDQAKRHGEYEKSLTWIIPLIIIFYSVLVIIFSLYANLQDSDDYVVPTLGVPTTIIVWASIGSLSSMIFRYYRREKSVVMIAEIRRNIGRFWFGVISGIFFYLVIRSGLFIISNQDIDVNSVSQAHQQFIWALVWLVSFSDAIFERVIARVTGNVLGDDAPNAIDDILKVVATEINDVLDKTYNVYEDKLLELTSRDVSSKETSPPVPDKRLSEKNMS